MNLFIQTDLLVERKRRIEKEMATKKKNTKEYEALKLELNKVSKEWDKLLGN